MISKVKCPNCEDTENIEYSAIKTVYFYSDELETQIDLERLQKEIENRKYSNSRCYLQVS